MRYWQALLPALAAAGISAPAAAGSDVYVPIAHSQQVFVLLQIPGEMPQARPVRHATQIAYYPTPSFNFEGVPIRLTETDFEIDCENGATRRLRSSAYRELGDRVGGESYSEEWTPVDAATPMEQMRRLACNGLSPSDATYANLGSAVGKYEKLLRDPAEG